MSVNAAIQSSEASKAATTVSKGTSKSTSKTENKKSFEEELKATSKSETGNEKEAAKTEESKQAADAKGAKEAKDSKDTKDSKDKQFDDEFTSMVSLNAGVNFTDFKYNNHQGLLARNIQDLTNVQDMMRDFDYKSAYSYENIKMSDQDALFFSNLVKSTDMSMQSVAGYLQQAAEVDAQAVQKSAPVSATLMNALSESMKTGQSVRIDFDKDVSVIMKVDKNGNISATFIPGDKAMEQYLRDNIGFLKQKFEEQNLSYSELNYKQSKQEQQEERKRNNKEKSNE